MGKQISVNHKIALVTGANRGIGKAIVEELIKKGAYVYACARELESLNELKAIHQKNLTPLQLEVTDDQSISRAAEKVAKLDILINNAGIINFGNFLNGKAIETLKESLDVNVTGLVKVTDAFVKLVSQNEAGAIVNISSMAGLGNMPLMLTYSASKAAVHSITQGLRAELKEKNILVAGVYPGPIDTAMTNGFDIQKDSPENVAKAIIEGIEQGEEEIFPDLMSKQMGPIFLKNPKQLETEFGSYGQT